MKKLKVLVIGSGGREHALAWKLARSPRVEKVYASPGSDGMSEVAGIVPLAAGARPASLQNLVAFARQEEIDLTVVGPEAPLVEGIADRFRAAGLRIFGPGRQAARIEGSKAFAKTLMAEAGIPTARSVTFKEPGAALAYVDGEEPPLVIKADGLAGGKGVVIAHSREEARDAVRRLMVEGVHGAAGRRVVIEEFLLGQELSVLALCDGRRAVPLAPSQDHKQVYDGDRGPNTGGMGAYSPVPWFDAGLADRVEREILAPAVATLAEWGMPYVGVLYAGLMLTEEGPRVLEFNARFGDPEAQAVLPRLEGDLAEILLAAAEGDLSGVELAWRPETAVCVVLASGGYPGPYETGLPIQGLPGLTGEALEEPPADLLVFHASTRRDADGTWRTAGGRVLNVVGLGPDLEAARQRAYRAVEGIHFDGMHYRRDIGRRPAPSRA